MQRILLHLSKLILLTATLFLVSCGKSQIVENFSPSQKTTENIDVTADFDKIRVSQNIEVELTQGATKSFEIFASDDARQNLEIEVEDGQLSIGFKNNILFRNNSKVKISITTPIINNLTASSSGKIVGMNTIKSKNLELKSSSGSEIEISTQADQLILTASSGSTIEVRGVANMVTAKSSSGSSIETDALSVKTAIARSSSGSSVELGITESLDATSSSGSSITFKGNPQIIQQKATSGSSISKK